MATNFKIRGVEENTERDPQADIRETKSIYKKFGEYLVTKEGITTAFIFFVASMLVLPLIAEYIFILALVVGIYLKSASGKTLLPFRLPESSGLQDWSEGQRGSSGKAKGISFLGNEMKTKNEIWFSSSDMRTHILLFGTTGAGKAIALKEKVYTPNGWVANKHLKLGDYVVTPKGQSRIIGIFPQGLKDFQRISFEDGLSNSVSKDHLWETYEINEENQKWLSFNDINEKEKQLLTTGQIQEELKKGKRLAIPLSEMLDKQKVELNYDITQIADMFVYILEDCSFTAKDTKIIQLLIKVIHNGSLLQRQQLLEAIKYKMPIDLILKEDEYCINDMVLAKQIQLLYKSLGYVAKITTDIAGNLILSARRSALIEITQVEDAEQEEAQCIKLEDERGLFVISDYTITHNTEFLLSLAFNSLVQGSGFLFCDGKGDPSLFSKIFSMARMMGRDDDLLTLNFMTGGSESFGKQRNKRSNTLNPFVFGSSSSLTEMLIGLMADGGGSDPMWKGRAMSLLSSQMKALVYLRDHKEYTLDIALIRDYMTLDKIYELAENTVYGENADFIKAGLQGYLLSIPGYAQGKKPTEQSSTVRDQHGYLQMQFTQLLSSLGETYGYIFKTTLGEIDFKDLVLNNRILVVPLPALEKSIDELRNLGKLVIINLKSMMTGAMGGVLEGEYSDLIESRPTNAPAPYLTILDEYGYYAAPGGAVIPAQGRSLGFSVCFAGQDYPGFKKGGNSEEAASTIGNCNVKIFMKIEDPNETFDLFNKLVGEAIVEKSGGKEYIEGGVFGGRYRDNNNVTTERRARATFLDLKQQTNGEAHVLFGDQMVRANLFWLNPPNPKEMRLNHFIKVRKPKRSEVQIENQKPITLIKNLIEKQQMIRDMLQTLQGPSIEIINDLADFMQDCKSAKINNLVSASSMMAYMQNEKMSVSLEQMQADFEMIDGSMIFEGVDPNSCSITTLSEGKIVGLDKTKTYKGLNDINEKLIGNGNKALSETDIQKSSKMALDAIAKLEKETSYPKGDIPEAIQSAELKRMLDKLNIQFKEDKD